MNNNSFTTKKYLVFNDVSSIYSEAFQHLQVNLDFSFVDMDKRLIAVTSSLPKEGKSTVITNLANIYAKKDFKVVLVDLDLRKPSLHRFFKIERGLGVSDYCIGKCTLKDIIKNVDKNFDIITAGTSTLFPSKLLESDILDTLVDELKKMYDYILFDTSPILTAPDAFLISKYVKQYILVARYGQTKKNDIEEVINQFNKNKVEITGVVINRAKIERKGSYRYKYQYQYGKETK